MPILRRLLACATLIALPALASAPAAIGANDVILIRHANAPGVGDPANFKLDDCSTQRNLSDEGRVAAKRMGDRLRKMNVKVGAVLSSQWCRTRETARLAFPAMKVRDEPAFNSWFGQEPVESESQLTRARELMQQWKGPGVLVVVTHAVNINALAGEPTAPAEAVVLHKDEKGELRVMGTLKP